MAKTYRTKFLVSLAVLATVILFQVSPALASCTTHTYSYGGRMVMCTVCCTPFGCNTNCF
jgi:hypothetical protein